jgi:hypothetical protein
LEFELERIVECRSWATGAFSYCPLLALTAIAIEAAVASEAAGENCRRAALEAHAV